VRQSSIQQPPLQPPIRANTAQGFIEVDVIFKEEESTSRGVLAADTELILDRARTLEVTAIAGVGSATKTHIFSPSLSDGNSDDSVEASRFFALFCVLRSARYMVTRAGMMTSSSHDFSAGSSFFPEVV
jgi:hypothetical protein